MLLLGFYHLVLEKEKMHQFNRFYLLGSVVFSLLVPSFIITVPAAEFVEPMITATSFDSNIPYPNSEITTVPIQEIDYTNYLISFYIVISAILFFLFVRKIYSLLLKIKQNKKVSYFKATVVLLKEQVLPHTFLNYIFINKNEYQTDNLEQQILTHELTHVQQKHTLDVLFIKVMEILFWFNPIFRFYRKAIQLNHEFLADDAVINSHKNISEYQHLLVSKTAQNNNIYLASNFNYSLTKKRLLMMTTPSSKTKILLKKLLILPLIVGFVFAFAQRVEAQENKDLPQVVEVKENNNGISDKEMKEYKRLITEGKSIKVFKHKDIVRMQNLYTRMSVKQQNSVEDIFKILPPPPPVSHQKKVPSILQFNSWKNKETYALWIDGKAIDNSELNNYKNSDFSYFIGSKVHKNARNKNFPQEYQFNLFTNAFFKKMKEKELNLETYMYLYNKYEKLRTEKPHFINSNKKKQNNLTFMSSRLGSIYFKLSKADKRKVKRALPPFHPYMRIIKNGVTSYKLKHELTEDDKKFLPPPPKPMKIQVIEKKENESKNKKIDKQLNEYLKKNKIKKVAQNSKLDLIIREAKLKSKFKFNGKTISSDQAVKLIKRNNKMYLSIYGDVNKKYNIVYISEKPIVVEVKEKQKLKKKRPKPVSIKVIEKTDSKELKEIIEEEEKVVEQHELREVEEEVEETEVVVDRIDPIEEVEVVEEVETPEIVEIIKEEKEFEVDNTKRIETLLKYIKSLKKKGAKFSYNKLPISYKKAKFLISKKGIYNIYAKEGKNKKINVILSDTPFVKEVIEK